jgi:hypothetical protein
MSNQMRARMNEKNGSLRCMRRVAEDVAGVELRMPLNQLALLKDQPHPSSRT